MNVAKRTNTYVGSPPTHPTMLGDMAAKIAERPSLEDMQREEAHRRMQQQGWESKSVLYQLLHDALHPEDEYPGVDLDRVQRLAAIVQTLSQVYP